MAVVMIFLFSGNWGFGQLAAWELSTSPGNQASNNATTTGTNIGTSILSRGAGITAGTAAGCITSSGWFNTAAASTLAQAITNNEYYEFTLPVNSGFQANITSIGLVLRSSGTGPNTATLRSSIDGFSSDLGTVSIITSSVLNTISVNLMNVTGITTFRLYGYGSAATSTSAPGTGGTMRIGTSTVATDNDLVISGTVSPLSTTPELASISNTSIAEGNAGTTNLQFTATLTAPSVGNTTITLASSDVTATVGSDFLAIPADVTILDGQISATFNVEINGDTDIESDETFTVTGTLNAISKNGTGTILDDDAPELPTLSINDVSVVEGNSGTTNASFTVSLSAPAPVGGITFDIATADNTATIANADYDAKSLTSQTIAAGDNSYTFTVLVNSDAAFEPSETFFVNLTNIVGASATDAQGQGTITNDDLAPATKIHAIQGSGATSTMLGTQTVQGIVTRVFTGTGSMNGFYVQEEDADADTDPLTSEGIFVFNPPTVPTVGDLVTVTGTVTEFGSTNKLTEISPTTSVILVSTGNPLPTVTNVTLPIANVTDWERYEGMLINVKAATGDLLVTENFELGRYGQVVLAAMDATTNQPDTDARIDQFTQFNAASVSGYSAYLAAVAKRTIYLDDAKTAQNTDPLLFGRGGMPLSASNTLRTGDAINNVTAVLDHSQDGYKLQTAEPVMFTPANPRPTSNPDVGMPTLKVGNMNVLNYFLTYTPAGRGADNATEFTRQKSKIISAILNSGLDLVSLNEIEQKLESGIYDKGEAALIDLITGLNAVAGTGVWDYIKPLVNTGTDQITCAIIYKPAMVTPKGAAKSVYGSAFAATGRAALVQTFEQNSNSADFTVVSVHYKSKGSVIDADIFDGQGANNITRTAQSVELKDWLANTDNGITDPDVIILGDINSYAKEDPITTLETAGYATLIPIHKYSYQFDGNFGALDHALGSASLASQVTAALKWNINSDEPIVLDYNTNFKTPGHVTSLYAPDEFRSSDHDPVIVGLNLTCDEITFNTTTVAVCDTYTWANNGVTYTMSGTYTGTTTNCVTEKLVLTITPSSINNTIVASCETYTWANNGQTYTMSGTYTGTTTNCVTEKLVLTINTKAAPVITNATICSTETYTWIVNNQVYSTNTSITVVGMGCDPDQVLNLTVTPKPTEVVTSITICTGGTYTWAVNGQTYTSNTSVTVTGLNCTADKTLILIVDDNTCSQAICTTLPADYANSSFMACTPAGNTIGVGVIMSSALAGMPNIFGLPVNNRTFTLNPADITSGDVYTMMAGTTNASSKFGLGGSTFTNSSTWPRVPLNASGQLANILFRNTLALYFNIKNSNKLGDVVMTNIHYTQPLTACGALTGTGVITSYQMPTGVIAYLNGGNGYNATVAGLYELANDALGGKVGVPNLSTIASAIDKINKAFNGCRLISTPSTTPSLFGTGLKVTENNLAFDAPSKGGLFVTLIEGDAETGNILGVTEIGSDGISGFDPIINNTYKLILGTNPEGSRMPQAPNGYKIVGEIVTYYNDEQPLTNGPTSTSSADGIIEIGSANPNAGAKVAAGNRIEVEYLLEPTSPLPVTLISFTGKKQKNSNLLEWKTANEKGFDGFEIQKSENGNTFEKIGFVKGGNVENYEYSDNKLNSNTNYYRLKMIDLDGSSALSKIIAIQAENESNTIVGKVYPNPAVDKTAFVEITVEKAGVWKLTTFNAQGSLQTSNEVQLSKGVNNVPIEMNNLSQGIYFLNLENSNGEKFVRKVLKN
jgi:predicted extracellular nuclease